MVKQALVEDVLLFLGLILKVKPELKLQIPASSILGKLELENQSRGSGDGPSTLRQKLIHHLVTAVAIS